MMPPPDGFAILESLSSQSEENFLPVVVLTADTNEKTKRRALEAGATDFLLKPFDHVEVALRIRNLLNSRRAHLLLDNQRAALEDAVRERTAELRATIAELQKSNELLSQNG
jgi:putative two-component system response regulator